MLLALVLAIMLVLPGCSNKNVQAAKDFYVEFREKWNVSYEDAKPYLNTEFPEYYANAAEEFIKTVDYEIAEAKEINPKLVAITVRCLHEGAEEYDFAYHFVGMIDGEYRVMLAAWEVPEELREDLNQNDYTYGPDALILGHVTITD